MKRIAVWNTAFLGDAVLTLPLLQNLRRHYPEAVLDFYVRGGLAPLFSAHSAVDNVFAYDKRGKQQGASGLLALGREIRARQYSLWISAHTSARSGMLALASRAPVRIGYKKPAHSALWYTHTVDRKFHDLDEIERLLQLLNPLGITPESDWPEIVVAEEATAAASAFFTPLQGPFLGLHPGSVWGTKRWPAAYFADIGSRALQQGAQVLLFAGKGEEAIAEAVQQDILARIEAGGRKEEERRLHNLSGALSLPHLTAYLGRLSCYVTNDSGPMHLAWAQRTPVTAIFGPTVSSLGFFPRGNASSVFEVELPCRPCGLHGPTVCPLGHHHCMVQVSPEQVWADVRKKLWP